MRALLPHGVGECVAPHQGRRQGQREHFPMGFSVTLRCVLPPRKRPYAAIEGKSQGSLKGPESGVARLLATALSSLVLVAGQLLLRPAQGSCVPSGWVLLLRR